MEQTRTLTDSTLAKGHVVIEVVYDDGRVETIHQDNVIVNNGRDRIAALIAEDSTAFPSHIGIGTSATAAAVTDTALGAEVDRNAIVTSFASSGVATFKAFFSKSEANGNTIAEVGMFDQAAGGTMFCRSVLSSTVAKTASLALNITWTWTFADA